MARHDASVHQIKSPRTLPLSLSLSLSPHIPRHPHCVTSPHPPVTPERRVPLPASSAFSLSLSLSLSLCPSCSPSYPPSYPRSRKSKASVPPEIRAGNQVGPISGRLGLERMSRRSVPRGISACIELCGILFRQDEDKFDLDKLCPGTPGRGGIKLHTKRNVSRLLRNAEACILRHRSDIQALTAASSAPRRSCECTRCTAVTDARNPRRGLGPDDPSRPDN